MKLSFNIKILSFSNLNSEILVAMHKLAPFPSGAYIIKVWKKIGGNRYGCRGERRPQLKSNIFLLFKWYYRYTIPSVTFHPSYKFHFVFWRIFNNIICFYHFDNFIFILNKLKFWNRGHISASLKYFHRIMKDSA